MIAIEVKLNILWLAIGIVVLPLLGLLFRMGQIKSIKRKIEDLEDDLLQADAEILSLQEKIKISKEEEDVKVISLKEQERIRK